jgi:hypothetical protein
MNNQLEKLIDLALVDGILSDKERQVLQRKALELGVDLDEFEMVLDAKMYLAKKDSELTTMSHPGNDSEKPNSYKEGDLKKCPSCGAPVQSFVTNCADCGHEFRNTESTDSIRSFFNRLQIIVEEENNRHHESTGLDRLIGTDHTLKIEQRIFQRQISLISSFPIPNNKEDILEFLALASPEATKKISFFARIPGTTETHKGELRKAYFSKCEQIIMKARFAMKEDRKTLEEIEYYAKQLKIK